MVLVTHDQNEAMTFAKTVVVMNHGEVIQAGSPKTLFDHPATEYVGYFIGSPSMNYLPAVVEGSTVRVDGTALSVPLPPGIGTQGLKIGFRPEHMHRRATGLAMPGVIERVWYEGADEVLALVNGAHSFRARLPVTPTRPGQSEMLHIASENLRLYCDGRLVA